MKLRSRIDRLETQLPAPPVLTPRDRSHERRWHAVSGRFARLLHDALPLMNDDERRRVEHAVHGDENIADGRWAGGCWTCVEGTAGCPSYRRRR